MTNYGVFLSFLKNNTDVSNTDLCDSLLKSKHSNSIENLRLKDIEYIFGKEGSNIVSLYMHKSNCRELASRAFVNSYSGISLIINKTISNIDNRYYFKFNGAYIITDGSNTIEEEYFKSFWEEFFIWDLIGNNLIIGNKNKNNHGSIPLLSLFLLMLRYPDLSIDFIEKRHSKVGTFSHLYNLETFVMCLYRDDPGLLKEILKFNKYPRDVNGILTGIEYILSINLPLTIELEISFYRFLNKIDFNHLSYMISNQSCTKYLNYAGFRDYMKKTHGDKINE